KDDFFSYTMEGSPLNTSNISLVVPEPSALSLLAVGLGGFALIRRRRS
ncbi:MAG: PEP-CTERM sorting domain-containing protein, partial [Verrucomicrobia bacterium]|nr:PEP-CTERM sorting domain-containing protein [Verrucomicrobiota bacterium]